MVILANRELEDEVICGRYHIAVPVEVEAVLTHDCALNVTAYSFCRDIAYEYEKEFAADPFSDEAKQYLISAVSPIMQELGYDTSACLDSVMTEYRATLPDKSKILPECVIIDTLDGEQSDIVSLDEFMLDKSDECDRMAVIRQGGKIVCYAGVNDISPDDGYAEITTECIEDCRRRGYAVSCVSLLTEYLISTGRGVSYVAEDGNEVSKLTAAAAGFIPWKRTMPFVCYADGAE